MKPRLATWVVLFLGVLGLLFALHAQDIAPARALRFWFEGSLGTRGAWTATLRRFAPLCLMAGAIAFAAHARLWNVGAEGQWLAGALAGWYAANATDSWAIGLLAGAGAGVVAVSVPALLSIERGVSEILSGLLGNFLWLEVLRYLIGGPLQEPTGQFLQTATLPDGAILPTWRWTATHGMHLGVAIAIAVCVSLEWCLWRTRGGLVLRATGSAPRLVQTSGFSPRAARWQAFLVAGAACGLAGAIEVTGVTEVVDRSLASGVGYTSIAVALLVSRRPAWCIVSAFAFAALYTGTASLQWAADLPGIDRFAQALMGIAVLAILAVRSLGTRST